MADTDTTPRELIVAGSDEHWVAWTRGPRHQLACHSAAVRTDAGDVWVVDPLDVDGLDELLADYGRVAGVVLLLDRHVRDAVEIAERHGVQVWIPEEMRRNVPDGAQRYGERLPDTPFLMLPVVSRSFWTERALWWPERKLLVAADGLGTAKYFRASRRERLGVHPILRVAPPAALAPLRPDVVIVGHGAPLCGEPGAVTRAIETARRAIPGMVLRSPKRLWEWGRGGR